MVANASRPKRKIKLRFIHFSSRTCFDLDVHKSTPSSQRFSRRRGKCSKEMASKTRNSGIAQPLSASPFTDRMDLRIPAISKAVGGFSLDRISSSRAEEEALHYSGRAALQRR